MEQAGRVVVPTEEVEKTLRSCQSSQSSTVTRLSNISSANDETYQNRLARFLKTTVDFLIDQWFLLAMGIVIAISSQFQVPRQHQSLKTTVVTYLCVGLIFFITGCTLSTRTLLANYTRWKLHLFVQVLSFLVTSAVIFGVVTLCATNKNFMNPGLLIGLIFTGCTPTTISSNVVMTAKAHGNTALTVVQSTLGNFLGPFVMPALISLYTRVGGGWYVEVLPTDEGGYQEIYRRVFKQLGLSVFVPMVTSPRSFPLLHTVTSMHRPTSQKRGADSSTD
jgi:solute carrier family 10 (sodium/bile acid cotransporter), member 7